MAALAFIPSAFTRNKSDRIRKQLRKKRMTGTSKLMRNYLNRKYYSSVFGPVLDSVGMIPGEIINSIVIEAGVNVARSLPAKHAKYSKGKIKYITV